jgi:hypothetical protein
MDNAGFAKFLVAFFANELSHLAGVKVAGGPFWLGVG